jgi:murein DD-endopeptidase MepM/ murein hydrolase activator NlpD
VPADLPPPTFHLDGGRVAPKRAFYGERPLTVRARFSSSAPSDVRIEIRRRGGGVARRFDLRAVRPPGPVQVRWDGRARGGREAQEGHYRVLAGRRGGPLRAIGSFTFRRHLYPVRGRHRFRGAIGHFGAPRSGGRRHEGVDINARCGTPVAAARAGRVRQRRYDPVLYGNFVIVRSASERRDYWYSHLRTPARVRRGDRVRTGQRLGSVGATGNARSVGCHLHFELHGRRGPLDPLPRLRAWDRFS